MLRYVRDELGKEILVNPVGQQVMMEWEKPYMEHCINVLFPYGDVLEIGFGLGYSANQIQKFAIKSHTIIECDPEVLKRAREWANFQPNPVNIIQGTWQNTLPILGSFDCIFFDDFPFTETHYECYNSFKTFFDRIRKFHIKQVSKLVWYSEEPVDTDIQNWFGRYNTEFDFHEFDIEKPANLRTYALNGKNKMYVPELIIYK